MSNQAVLMGSFREIDPTVDTLDRLRELGISDGDISVLSGLPYSSEVLGRPHIRTWLPLISLTSALLGFLTGLFFTVMTPYLYIIRVGGQPIVPVPPTVLLLYEFTMLFLIVGTFGGFLVLNRFPSREAEYYDDRVNEGRISLLVRCADEQKEEARAILEAHGAEDIHEPERRKL
jgi:hypothetical protein